MRATSILLLVLVALPLAAPAQDESFTVDDIRVEGVQRLSAGTVLGYLPVRPGDRVDRQRIAEAVRSVYASGLFSDVTVGRDGATLVVTVVERPVIRNISVRGNRDIQSDDILGALRAVGLDEGKPYDAPALDRIQLELTTLYLQFGKYTTTVNATATETDDGRVDVNVVIVEGRRARIEQINVTGNEFFSDDEILEGFRLKPRGLLASWTDADLFSRATFDGDLENLKSRYYANGFADFDIRSDTVALSPTGDAVFITVNIEEGRRYTVSAVDTSIDSPSADLNLESLVLVRSGQTFNGLLIEETAAAMKRQLGSDGFAFANVEPRLVFDEPSAAVSVIFEVTTGSRAYVRRIEFEGAGHVRDTVLRRAMTQLEGAPVDTSALEKSRRNLAGLPYVGTVDIAPEPVTGNRDLVDIRVTLTESPAREYRVGGGFTDSQRLRVSGFFVNENLLGTGQRLALDAGASDFQNSYSLSHTDPFRTLDGLSRTIALNVRDIDQLTSGSSDLDIDTASASLRYRYRTTEYQSLQFEASLEDTEVLTDTLGSQQTISWVQNNGNPGSSMTGDPARPFEFDTDYNVLEFRTDWIYDTRNRTLLADRGTRQQLTFRAAVPGSEVEYYTAEYDLVKFQPLPLDFTLRLRTRLGFGEDYNDTTALPPYLNWFAGGPDSVRGFRESRLGPRDSLGNPYGGNLFIANQLELMVPMPESLDGRARLKLFYDVGNVFSTGHVAFNDANGQPLDFDFDVDELKQSAGVALDVVTPLGPLVLSYGWPLDPDEDNANPFLRDEVDRFQISIGFSF